MTPLSPQEEDKESHLIVTYSVKEKFKRFCKAEGLLMSKTAEKALEEFMQRSGRQEPGQQKAA